MGSQNNRVTLQTPLGRVKKKAFKAAKRERPQLWAWIFPLKQNYYSVSSTWELAMPCREVKSAAGSPAYRKLPAPSELSLSVSPTLSCSFQRSIKKKKKFTPVKFCPPKMYFSEKFEFRRHDLGGGWGGAAGEAGAEKGGFFTLFIKLLHCHFTEAGRERAREGERSDRQRLQGSFSRQLRAGSGTEPFVPGKFSRRERVGVCRREKPAEK